MAEALLRRHLERAGIESHVSSAGFSASGQSPTTEILEVMADRGLDVSMHRSRRIDASMLDQADLVVGMARRHVRDCVVMAPACLSRAFTLKELNRRIGEVGLSSEGEALAAWSARLAAGRSPTSHLGDDPDDDVVDPMGRRFRIYQQVAAEIDGLIAGLAPSLVLAAERRP
jgi:protein-tyrosine phosphatase